MKSSTIRRSNLTKERMAVLESLSKYGTQTFDNSPGVYIRPDKEKELDLLWQNFNVKKRTNKQGLYLTVGFVAGAVVMLVLGILISFTVNGINSIKENSQTLSAPVKKEKMSLNFIPSSGKAEEPTATNEVYSVQSGDTMEAILVRFYGSYSKEKEALVLKTNNLTNPNKLSIGQELTIPME